MRLKINGNWLALVQRCGATLRCTHLGHSRTRLGHQEVGRLNTSVQRSASYLSVAPKPMNILNDCRLALASAIQHDGRLCVAGKTVLPPARKPGETAIQKVHESQGEQHGRTTTHIERKGHGLQGRQNQPRRRVLTGFDLSTWNGIPQARLGDQVFCPKCKPHKHVISAVSGMNVHGVQSALHNDVTSCGATLIAESASPAEVTSAMAFMRGDAHDEQFLLHDEQGRPMVHTFYTLKFPDGCLVHGQTDEAGHTERIFTDRAQQIDIQIGHLKKDIRDE